MFERSTQAVACSRRPLSRPQLSREVTDVLTQGLPGRRRVVVRLVGRGSDQVAQCEDRARHAQDVVLVEEEADLCGRAGRVAADEFVLELFAVGFEVRLLELLVDVSHGVLVLFSEVRLQDFDARAGGGEVHDVSGRVADADGEVAVGLTDDGVGVHGGQQTGTVEHWRGVGRQLELGRSVTDEQFEAVTPETIGLGGDEHCNGTAGEHHGGSPTSVW